MAHISKPEQHGRRWRVRIDYGRGSCPCCGKRRHPLFYDTEEQATKGWRRLVREYSKDQTTIDEAIDRFVVWLRDVRKRERNTYWTYEVRLQKMFVDDLEQPVSSITRRRAQQIYEGLVERSTSDTTQIETLNHTKTFFRRCVAWGLTRSNPFEQVEPIGRKSARAEAQALSEDEAGELYRACLAAEDDPGAVATLLALMLGLRASAIARIGPRDLDAGGTKLRIRKDKNRAGRRAVLLHPVLAERIHLLVQVENRDRYWVHRHVKRWCKAAGVTPVGPHALRATNAALNEEAGIAWAAFGPALGHSSEAVTQRHYVPESARVNGRQRAAFRVLDGGNLGEQASRCSPKRASAATVAKKAQ